MVFTFVPSETLIISQLDPTCVTPVKLPNSLNSEPLINGVLPSSTTLNVGIATPPSGVVNSKVSENGEQMSSDINLYFTYTFLLASLTAGYQPSLKSGSAVLSIIVLKSGTKDATHSVA